MRIYDERFLRATRSWSLSPPLPCRTSLDDRKTGRKWIYTIHSITIRPALVTKLLVPHRDLSWIEARAFDFGPKRRRTNKRDLVEFLWIKSLIKFQTRKYIYINLVNCGRRSNKILVYFYSQILNNELIILSLSQVSPKLKIWQFYLSI